MEVTNNFNTPEPSTSTFRHNTTSHRPEHKELDRNQEILKAMEQSQNNDFQTYHFLTTAEYANIPKVQVPGSAIWKGFTEFTTAHGVPHVKNARGRKFCFHFTKWCLHFQKNKL